LQVDHRFESVNWTHLHPPETFSFVARQVLWQSAWRKGWLYNPSPETKAAHFQSGHAMELILPQLVGLKLGNVLRVCCNCSALTLSDPA
jgi:hypothetical protein